MLKAIGDIQAFLKVETPDRWLSRALLCRKELMIDHANCEKKAAATAMSLLYRYIDRPELLSKLSQLAREELLHFEQVLGLMQEMQIEYAHLSPGRYASVLHKHIRTHEPKRLIDSMLVGAIVEARSCERFHRLSNEIDEPLAGFYKKLLASEARHFKDYLNLAELYADDGAEIPGRLSTLLDAEAQLIAGEDKQFRFLGGVPFHKEE